MYLMYIISGNVMLGVILINSDLEFLFLNLESWDIFICFLLYVFKLVYY